MDAELEAYLDHMLGFIGDRFTALEARIDARFDALEQRFDALEARVGALEARVGALETRVGALETRIGALETRVGEGFVSVDGRFRTLELALAKLSDRVTTDLAALEHRLLESIANLTERVVALEGRFDELAAGQQATRASLDALREHVRMVAQQSASLEANVLGRLDRLEQELTGLSRRVDGLSDDMRQRFRVVNDRLGDIDRRLAA